MKAKKRKKTNNKAIVTLKQFTFTAHRPNLATQSVKVASRDKP